MNLALYTALFAVLLIMALEDLKDRSIHWFWLPALAVILYSQHVTNQHDFIKPLLNFAINGITLTFMGCFLHLFLSLIKRKPIHLFRDFIGIGDVLLLFCFGLAFEPMDFILFFTLSLSLTLVIHLGITLFVATNRMIPLVTYLNVCFGIYLLCTALDLEFEDLERMLLLDSAHGQPNSYFEVSGYSQYSVLGTQFSVLGSRSSVLGAQYSVLSARSSVLTSNINLV